MSKISAGEKTWRDLSLAGKLGVGLHPLDEQNNIYWKCFIVADQRREFVHAMTQLREISALQAFAARSAEDYQTLVDDLVDKGVTPTYLIISDPLRVSRYEKEPANIESLIDIAKEHWPIHTILLSDKEHCLDVNMRMPYDVSIDDFTTTFIHYAQQVPSAAISKKVR
ncbi:hypothetical protein D6774_04290 [Candidatus Woesearchaeota archaeon]|nr:MAG: hypothetical protein D6774_04290 [Candidatus Woesearchaeota archaeon]